MRFALTLCLSALIALATPVAAETLLTPHKAQYRVKISVLGGQLNTELQATADGYRATHTIRATGMSRMLANGRIRESSVFDSQSDGIRPVNYISDDTLTRDKIRASISFDWANGEASGTVNNEDFQSAMDGLAYDRVSIQYELMSDLMSGGASAEYILFDIDELKTVTVRNIGRRTVEVPAGTYEAIGVQHQTPGSKRVTTMWCVEDLDYLPVIIEQHRKGKLRMRAELSRYSPLET
ncbi:MAG: DUF3108 domain-containing protein [Woeseiaceae bacterium]